MLLLENVMITTISGGHPVRLHSQPLALKEVKTSSHIRMLCYGFDMYPPNFTHNSL